MVSRSQEAGIYTSGRRVSGDLVGALCGDCVVGMAGVELGAFARTDDCFEIVAVAACGERAMVKIVFWGPPSFSCACRCSFPRGIDRVVHLRGEESGPRGG